MSLVRSRGVTAFLWLLFGLGLAGWFWYSSYQTPCRRTLHYAIGQFDTQFGESKDDFITAAAAAEAVWEAPTGFNLFTYDPAADFKLNLVFDERQQTTNEQRQLQDEITSDSAGFDQQKALYETQHVEYERRAAALKAEVDHYNANGGAPQDVYDRLEAERKSLNTLAAQLNTLSDRLNSKANTLNTKIGTFNTHVGHIFDQANYTGTEINLYEFQSQQDMVLALSHEFGHALGLEHVSDPKAIMYYLLDQQSLEHPSLTDADLSALRAICSARPTFRLPHIVNGKLRF